MATVVALVSVVASAIVAISVPLLSGRSELIRQMAEQRASRVDELRSIVDEASVAIAFAERLLQVAETDVELACRRAATSLADAAASRGVSAAQLAVQDAHTSLHRLAARLGWEADTVQAYKEVSQLLTSELQTIKDVYDGGPTSDTLAWAGVTQSLQEVRTQRNDIQRQFYATTALLIGLID